MQGLVPPNAYLLNAGVHTAALASNPDLTIEYGVVDISNGNTPSWIQYNSANRTLTIEETDETKDGTYRMRVEAWFSYRPQLRFKSPSSFMITLVDKCRMASLNPTLPESTLILYNLGDPVLTLSLPEWANDIPDGSCDPMVYTAKLRDPLSGSLNPIPSFLELWQSPLRLKVFSLSDTSIGSHQVVIIGYFKRFKLTSRQDMLIQVQIKCVT